MKRLISLFLAFVMAFGILSGIPFDVFSGGIVAQAASYESESNDSYSTADVINLSNTVYGTIGNSNDKDFYKIVPTSNGKISLIFNHTWSEGTWKGWVVDVYQYTNGSYNPLSSIQIWSDDDEKISLPCIGAVANGVYYVTVKSYGGYSYVVGEEYGIQASFTASNYYEKEPNNAYSTATKVTLGKTYKGTINNYNDKDYYKIVPASNGKINLIFNHTWSEGTWKGWVVDVYQYTNGSYNPLSSTQIWSDDDEKISLPCIGAVANGVYYVTVKSYGGHSYVVGEEYGINVSFRLNTPQLTSVTASAKGATVKWGKVSGADSYNIYRKTYNASTKSWSGWSRIKTGATSTSYTDTTAKSGVYYRYTVIAKNEAGSSGYNTAGLKIKFLATPKLTSIANNTGKVTVKWNKVSGATGYIVYRRTYNATTKTWGGWTRIATTKSNAYNDTTAKGGVYYRYTVRAYCNGGDYVSSFDSTGIQTKYLATPTLKAATSTKAGVKVTWGKVSGAKGYDVYRRTYSGGKWSGWSKIATTESGSTVAVTDKTAKKGVTYRYTVRAKSDSYKSYYNTKGLQVKDKY